MSKLIDAVSVVFCHGTKIFTIKRQNYLKAFPGYLAFPGGKVDKGDHGKDDAVPATLKKYPSHLIHALIREMQEEMGMNIEASLASGDIGEFSYLGVAITPDFNPVRFATHFFRLDMKSEMPLTACVDEAKECGWHETKFLSEEYSRGNILVVPPIMKLINILKDRPDLKEAVDLDFHYDPHTEVPMIESIKGLRQLPVLSNTLFPATRTNCFVLGDEGTKKVVVDPSPKNEAEYQKLLQVLEKLKVAEVMLTHHHGDHNEFAPKIGDAMGIPLSMSADTYSRLKRIHGEEWFLKTKIKELKEGDVLATWIGEDLIIHSIPGHDEGHLGIAPRSLKWFIVGDLFQGVGTVVIGGEEGSMKKYMETLEKVIKLSPKAVFPSHGIGLGGTFILEKTLEHRKLREEQVLKMHQAGKSKEEMLSEIYFDVDPKLSKYAMANINSHLIKLQQDGKI